MATTQLSSLLLLLFLTTAVSAFTSVTSLSPIAQEQQHVDRIIEAMVGADDFRHWASDFLSAIDDQLGLPLSATLFIPSGYDTVDGTTITGDGSGSNTTTTMSPLAMAYHIVPQRLSFSDLLLMKPLSRLPTLLPGNSILIANNSVSNFTLDGSLLSDPDLFLSSTLALHGVSSPLDFSIYGGYAGTDDSLVPGVLTRPPHGTSGDGVSGSDVEARFLSGFEFQVVLAVVFGILAVKNLF